MLGSMRVALARLLKDEDMTQVQQFPLSSSGPNSTLKLKLVLRVSVVFTYGLKCKIYETYSVMTVVKSFYLCLCVFVAFADSLP